MNEQALIESVISKLLEEGVINGTPSAQTAAAISTSASFNGEPVTLSPLDEVKVEPQKHGGT